MKEIIGKFNTTEQAILDYLYCHPDKGIGTGSLMRALRPDQDAAEKQKQAYREIQGAIETLVGQGLAEERGVSASGEVYFDNLRLTTKGERVAIKKRKNGEDGISLEIVDLGTDK